MSGFFLSFSIHALSLTVKFSKQKKKKGLNRKKTDRGESSVTKKGRKAFLYLTVILRGRAGYELIYITNEAVGKSEKNNCFSKSSSNSLDFFG